MSEPVDTFNTEPTNVYLVTSGSGSDGDEWMLHFVCATREVAEKKIQVVGGLTAIGRTLDIEECNLEM